MWVGLAQDTKKNVLNVSPNLAGCKFDKVCILLLSTTGEIHCTKSLKAKTLTVYICQRDWHKDTTRVRAAKIGVSCQRGCVGTTAHARPPSPLAQYSIFFRPLHSGVKFLKTPRNVK